MFYFIRIRGNRFGPFGEDQLVQMKITGKIGPLTDVSDDGFTWKSAGSLPFLYPPAPVVSALPEPVVHAESFRPAFVSPPLKNPGMDWTPYILLGGIATVLFLGVLGIIVVGLSIQSSGTNVAATASPQGGKTERTTDPRSSAPLQTHEIIERIEQSVAHIQGLDGHGSGFLIHPGIVATNYHVISREFLEQVEVTFPSASGSRKGPFDTKLLYADADHDIAFLSVKSDLPPLALADDFQFKRGLDIIAIGSPGDLENAVNVGVLSSETMIEGQKHYQLGISINPGNSGGPVIDREARVIGIVTLKDSKQEGIAWCVTASDVLDALARADNQTESEKRQNNSYHRARVALNLLTAVHIICWCSMDEIDDCIELAVKNGKTADDGVQAATEEIEKRMEAVRYIFLDKVEKELDTIKKDTNLPWEFRNKLAAFHANCLEVKSYVDRPRGTPITYRKKLLELSETGDRLHQQLCSLLGLPVDRDD